MKFSFWNNPHLQFSINIPMCRFGKTLESFKSLSARLGWVQHEDTKSIVYEAWRDTQLHIASLMNHCSVPGNQHIPSRKGKSSSKCTFKRGICYFPGGYASFPTNISCFSGLTKPKQAMPLQEQLQEQLVQHKLPPMMNPIIQSRSPPGPLGGSSQASEVVNNPHLLVI